MLVHVAGATHSFRNHLKGKRILVVEDEVVMAVDYYFQLRGLGAQPQAYASTIKDTLDYLAAR
jgi:hypothetical protein